MSQDVSMEFEGVIKPIFKHYMNAIKETTKKLESINAKLERIADSIEYYVDMQDDKARKDIFKKNADGGRIPF